jgi:histidinol-phosphate phosphatase family protein
MTPTPKRPAAFVDRDGTLIVEHGFLSDPEGVDPLPGSAEAVRQLNAWDLLVIGVTNQSGVARGYFGEDVVRAVNARVIAEFARRGARIDAIYYCPHYPRPGEAECGCRKPARGMIDRAMREFPIELSNSFAVGDRACDIQLAHTLGITGILVLTGYGREELASWKTNSKPDHVAGTLLEAVGWWAGGANAPKTPD